MGRKQTSILWFVPAAALLAVVVVYPILRTLILSFVREDLSTGFRAEFVGTDNFIRLILDSRFRNSLWTTAFFTTASVAAESLIGLLLALSVDAMRTWRNAIRVIFLAPWTTQKTVTVGVATLSGAFTYEIPWGQIAAGVVASALPSIVLLIIFQRKIVAGLTAGAVK